MGTPETMNTETLIATIIGLVIGIIVNAICARLMCKLARKKGYNAEKEHIFAICFWLGVFGWIYTIYLPDLVKREYLSKLAEIVNPHKPTQPKVDNNNERKN